MVNGKVHKNGFTIIEVTIVFLLILAVTFLVLPHSLDNTRQAKLISQWTQKYSEIEYTFSVIKAQQNGIIVPNELDNKLTKNAVEALIKPYFRITKEVTNYHPTFKNKKIINAASAYYFNILYFTDSSEILGLKLINEKCLEKQICAMMSFDINGLESPNAWGRDIYGIYILKDQIEPIGKEVSPDVLRYDCGKKGSGVFCSYYYLLGGKFD